MAILHDVIKQVDTVARKAASSVIERAPSPEGCGCARRKEKMMKSIDGGKSAGEIVKELLQDIRGK